MKPTIILTALLSAVPAIATAAVNSDVSGIAPYVYPQNAPERPSSLTYMPDGASYLMLSADGRSITRHETATGKQTEVFVDLDNTRETRLGRIDGFVLSPDASKVMVYTDRKPVYRRSFTARYYVYEVRSRLLKPLSVNHSEQQAPLFSPDSRMVAFAADNNVYIKKLDYETEVAVTTDGERNRIINGTVDWTYEEEFATVSSMTWAPDNLTLCYLRYDESQVPTYTFPLYQGTCEPRDEYAYYPGQFSYKYPVAGQPNSRVTVHSYDIETRKVKDIALPDARIEYIPRIAYAGSASNLVITTLNREQNHLEIYTANPRSTVVKSLYVEESKTWIAPETYETLTLADDHFVINSSRSGFAQIYKYSYSGTELARLSRCEGDVTAYYGTDARGNVYYQAAMPTPMDRTVYRVDRKGAVSVVGKDKGTTSLSFAPGMEYYMMDYSNVTTPPVYTMHASASGKTLRTIEDNAAYASRYASLPVKEFFTMTGEGGITLNGYMIKPAGFDASRRYPVVMYQYSGPGSQEVLDRWKMDWDYYFAMKGYVVMCVDGRGTGGRGREFMDVVYKRLGHYETIDQLSAARHAATLPYVDASRIGIFGWSYGGYETLMAASAKGAPYAAAVAVAPVTDWRYYDTVYAERYMSTPQQNHDGYVESAPINRASSLGCPLLIMTGTADDNVHELNTLQYVSTLQSEGILCDMLVFPNMNHSINGCNARSVVYARMLRFFNDNMK